MSLFAQGRVLITPQPEYMAGFPTGKVPDARQPLSVDRSLVPFFTDPRVITAAGGIEGLERWLSRLSDNARIMMRDITTSKQSS